MKKEIFLNKLVNTYPVNITKQCTENLKEFLERHNLSEIDLDLLYNEILNEYKPYKNKAFPEMSDIKKYWQNIENRSIANREFKNKYESAQEELDRIIEKTKTWSVEKIVAKGKMCRNIPNNYIQAKHIEFLNFWDNLLHESGIMDDMKYDNKRKIARLEFVKNSIIKNEYFVPLRLKMKNIEKLNFEGQTVE